MPTSTARRLPMRLSRSDVGQAAPMPLEDEEVRVDACRAECEIRLAEVTVDIELDEVIADLTRRIEGSVAALAVVEQDGVEVRVVTRRRIDGGDLVEPEPLRRVIERAR